ncbi:hematopoietic prostaglandin D synthase-like [Ptychodera flava]|uniref:hematopoietic prostaglandin D synthase-like n=1 Tax=Ptychodera flava TaxID=63121 RepID=UPI003969CBC1
MPKYKLTYFNGRGRGEVSRMIFALAGVEYEDNRIAMEEWGKLKADTRPFQVLPTLEIDDNVVLAQSLAIMRFLANENGLAGKNNLEKAKVDMLVDAMADLGPDIVVACMFLPEDQKAAKKAELIEKKVPTVLGNVERLLSENNEGKGFFVGDSVTWADLMLLHVADTLPTLDAGMIKKFPKLEALADRVRNLPKLKEWLKKRPETPF